MRPLFLAALLSVPSVPAYACCTTIDGCIAKLTETEGADTKPDSRPLRANCADEALLSFPASEVVPRLIPLLEHADTRVTDRAAHVLGRLKKDAAPAVQGLSALADRDPNGWALWALARIGDPKGIDSIVRNLGVGGASHLEPFGLAAVPPLIRLLSSPAKVNGRALTEASQALQSANASDAPEAVAHVEALRAALKAELAKTRLSTPIGCVAGAKPSPYDEDPCTLYLEDCMPIAAHLVEALWAFREKAKPAEPELLIAYASKNPRLRLLARRLLATLQNPAVLPAVSADLRDKEWGCRDSARRELALLGPIAKSIIPDLEKALERGPWNERDNVADTLGRIPDASVIAPLTRALAAPNWWVQREAAVALRRTGGAEGPLAALATTHWSPEVRKAAGGRGPACESALHNAGSLPAEVVLATGEKVRLSSIERASDPTCGERFTFTILAGEDCLAADHRGEWGGSIGLVDEGALRPFFDEEMFSPRAARLFGGDVLVFESNDHLGSARGTLTRVSKSSREWGVERFFELSGTPEVAGLGLDGSLYVAAEGGWAGCSSMLFRIKPDWTVEVAK